MDMGAFIFLMSRPHGGDAAQTHRTTHDTPSGRDHWHHWETCGPCSARIMNDGYGSPAALVRGPTGLAAGVVRLDNRHEISELAGCDDSQSDLMIMVAALARHGDTCISKFEGDFAFVYWDSRRGLLIAARDALGVRTLYHTVNGPSFAYASHASLIGADRPWSLEYIADYIACNMSRTRTPYEGVHRIKQGTYHIVRDESTQQHAHWSPYAFDTNWTMDGDATVTQFASLFQEAVRLRLTNNNDCWSQLSGGLDSSSIVSMAGWLARANSDVPRLSGTVTYVDSLGNGDERAYSDAVIRDWSVRNEQLVDYGMWQEGEATPPTTDEPEMTYPWFARDQLACRIVRSSGGRTLLSGQGSDHYLTGGWDYFADWIARGRVTEAIREMYRLAVLARASFWKLTYESAIRPLLGLTPRERSKWPGWVLPSFARQFPIEDREGPGSGARGTAGRLFVTGVANEVDLMEHALFRGVLSDLLDIRYPFLHRPLVEFSLQLQPEMILRFRLRKWILREAMRGILPEVVRQRKIKGVINGRVERSMTVQRAQLNALLENSILGEMGCIDVRLAQRALARPQDANAPGTSELRHALTLETWLRVRSGRWTAQEHTRMAV